MSDTPPAKPRVLFVDDEKVIADTTVMILNKSGYEAHAAYSGKEALELAPSLSPDIFMCDIIMCDLNGIEAAILLHDMLPSTRIFLHCGWAGAAEMLENARDRGYEFELMPLPFSVEDLLNRLSSPSDPQNIFNADRIRNPPRPAMPHGPFYRSEAFSPPAQFSRFWNLLRRFFKGPR